MTSHVDQGDVASFERCVAEIKKTDGQTSSYAASDDPEKPSASSLAVMQQFHADWSHFETVSVITGNHATVSRGLESF